MVLATAVSVAGFTQGQMLLNMLIGGVLPLLVGVVTHKLAAGWLKSWSLMVLSIVAGLLTTVTIQTFRWQDFLTNFAMQFGTAVLAHFGAYKPMGVTDAVQNAVPGGIGASTGEPAPAPVVTVPVVASDTAPEGDAAP